MAMCYFYSYFLYKSAEGKNTFKKGPDKLPFLSSAENTGISSNANNGVFNLFPASNDVPRDVPGTFPYKSHLFHLFKRRGRLLVSTADKNSVVHMPFAGMWRRLHVSCHPNIFQRVVSLA